MKKQLLFLACYLCFSIINSVMVHAGEREENLRRCLDGNYPSLCNYSLLSSEELVRAKEAERQVNLKRCLDGNYPSLCNYSLLSAGELARAKEAERQVNLKRCLDGNYPSLCNNSLLSKEELGRAKEAERQVNLKRCLDGNYPSLCNYSLLSDSELKKAKEAETKAGTSKKNSPAKGAIKRSTGGSCYEASIVKPSPFMGNDGEIFKLDDGTLWEVKYEYEYLYEYYPEVIICPSKGKLVIDGKSLDVEYVGGP